MSPQKKDKAVLAKAEEEELPPGWKRELSLRKSGSRTKVDKNYTDPVTGYIFHSFKDVQRYLKTGEIGKLATKPKDNVDMDNANKPSAGKKSIEAEEISGKWRHKRPLENGSEPKTRQATRQAGIKIQTPPSSPPPPCTRTSRQATPSSPPPSLSSSPPEPKTRQATRQAGMKDDVSVTSSPDPKTSKVASPPPCTRTSRQVTPSSGGGINATTPSPSPPEPKTRRATRQAGIKIDTQPPSLSLPDSKTRRVTRQDDVLVTSSPEPKTCKVVSPSDPETTSKVVSSPKPKTSKVVSLPERKTSKVVSPPEPKTSKVVSPPEPKTTSKVVSPPEPKTSKVVSPPEPKTTSKVVSSPELKTSKVVSSPEPKTNKVVSSPEPKASKVVSSPEPKTTSKVASSPEPKTSKVVSPPEPKTRHAKQAAGIKIEPKTRRATRQSGIKIEPPPPSPVNTKTSHQTTKRVRVAETADSATRKKIGKKAKVENADVEDKQENSVVSLPLSQEKVNKDDFTPSENQEYHKEIVMGPAPLLPVSHITMEQHPPSQPTVVHQPNLGMQIDKKSPVVSAPITNPTPQYSFGGDMNTNSSMNFSLNDLWTDPCIEFAVKTLTGAIPFGDLNKVDNFAAASPVKVPMEELWTDPCIEFAVKTLTGAIPIAKDDYLSHQHASSSKPRAPHDYSLPDVVTSFSQTEVLSHRFEMGHNYQQQESVVVSTHGNGGLQKPGNKFVAQVVNGTSNGQSSRSRFFQ